MARRATPATTLSGADIKTLNYLRLFRATFLGDFVIQIRKTLNSAFRGNRDALVRDAACVDAYIDAALRYHSGVLAARRPGLKWNEAMAAVDRRQPELRRTFEEAEAAWRTAGGRYMRTIEAEGAAEMANAFELIEAWRFAARALVEGPDEWLDTVVLDCLAGRAGRRVLAHTLLSAGTRQRWAKSRGKRDALDNMIAQLRQRGLSDGAVARIPKVQDLAREAGLRPLTGDSVCKRRKNLDGRKNCGR